jgi:hypothetical protein
MSWRTRDCREWLMNVLVRPSIEAIWERLVHPLELRSRGATTLISRSEAPGALIPKVIFCTRRSQGDRDLLPLLAEVEGDIRAFLLDVRHAL